MCHGDVLHDVEVLDRRGPDYQGRNVYELNTWCLQLYSTVLHMRGQLSPQPIEHATTGDVLMWNAEIFGGIEIPKQSNDGEILLEILAGCTLDDDILNVFKQIQGPYAFIFVQKKSNTIWFGRDVFGRRSLTFYIDSNTDEFLMASVAPSPTQWTTKAGCWQELAAAGIYKMQLSDHNYIMHCWPWSHNSMEPNDELNATLREPLTLHGIEPLNMAEPLDGDVFELTNSEQPLLLALEHLEEECDGLLKRLEQAVYKRVGGHSYYCHLCSPHTPCGGAHISVMFSGGIDSMMLAYLADKIVPEDEPIDLLNVAFQTSDKVNFDVPDRLTGLQALEELSSRRQWNFVEINVTKEELQGCRIDRISSLIQPLNSVLDDSIGCAIWFASRGAGIVKDRQGNTTAYTSTARVVLSGLGADEQLGGYSRLTLLSYKKLLIENWLEDLDENLSKGGHLLDTKACLFFLHRSRFKEGGYEALLQELNKDIMRISARNLGRDDRVIGDHGKEARFPFLDEEFVSYVNQLPVYKKMDLRLPRGIGEKLLLRACAFKCQLPITAQLAKRAIQFGSRIAKSENRNEKGSDVCARLSKGTKGALS